MTRVHTMNSCPAQMQYPTLVKQPQYPGQAMLPKHYPGDVHDSMSLEYFRFHKTWTRSDDFEAQTAGLMPLIVNWLRVGHDRHLDKIAYMNGFELDEVRWEHMTFHLASRAEAARIQAARMDAARMNADRMV